MSVLSARVTIGSRTGLLPALLSQAARSCAISSSLRKRSRPSGSWASRSHAQVYAPPNEDCVALEPMTAPAAALTSGRGLRVVEPDARFRATFRIGVGEL